MSHRPGSNSGLAFGRHLAQLSRHLHVIWMWCDTYYRNVDTAHMVHIALSNVNANIYTGDWAADNKEDLTNTPNTYFTLYPGEWTSFPDFSSTSLGGFGYKVYSTSFPVTSCHILCIISKIRCHTENALQFKAEVIRVNIAVEASTWFVGSKQPSVCSDPAGWSHCNWVVFLTPHFNVCECY